jgi:Ran GTPase-activating protein (RanGAP) involved in mRNA processing and transport
LYLAENEFTDDEVRMSAKSVAKDNGTLEILSLTSNPFVTNHCVIYLHPMIKQNHTLQQLGLDNCNLSREGETTSNGTTRKRAIS